MSSCTGSPKAASFSFMCLMHVLYGGSETDRALAYHTTLVSASTKLQEDTAPRVSFIEEVTGGEGRGGRGWVRCCMRSQMRSPPSHPGSLSGCRNGGFNPEGGPGPLGAPVVPLVYTNSAARAAWRPASRHSKAWATKEPSDGSPSGRGAARCTTCAAATSHPGPGAASVLCSACSRYRGPKLRSSLRPALSS